MFQYCEKPDAFREDLKEHWEHNNYIRNSTKNINEFFDANDLKSELQKRNCRMNPSPDGGQSFCPESVFDKLRQMKATTKHSRNYKTTSLNCSFIRDQ